MNLPNSFEQMVESRFLRKEDVTPDKLFTIANFEMINVAPEDKPEEMKWCVHFKETAKPMVLGPTNLQLMKGALGISKPADAIGRQIVVFNDPSVSYAGKLTGGIRLRAARVRQADPAPAPVRREAIDPFDELDPPF